MEIFEIFCTFLHHMYTTIQIKGSTMSQVKCYMYNMAIATQIMLECL